MTAAPATDRWCCLMYHEVEAEGDSVPYFGVSAARFTAHLDRCAALGRPAQSLEHVLGAAARSAVTSVLALTFDDGHLGCYTHAFPALARRGMTATFFIVTDWVGRPNRVSWPQLREMAAAGMSIQSHTHTHPFLSTLSSKDVTQELMRSRALIEDHVGTAVTTISLPNGDPPRHWNSASYADAGYRWVATSQFGPNSSRPPQGTICRVTVRRETSDARFDAMVRADASALWSEGARLRILAAVRSVAGMNRYAAARRLLLRLLMSGRG